MEKEKKKRMWVGLGLILGFFLISTWAYICFGVLKDEHYIWGVKISSENNLCVFTLGPILSAMLMALIIWVIICMAQWILWVYAFMFWIANCIKFAFFKGQTGLDFDHFWEKHTFF